MQTRLSVICALLVWPLLTDANASPRDAIEFVGDAVKLVRDEGGKCRRDVMEDLREIEDRLHDADYDGARRLLKAVEREAERCPARVAKSLRRAVRALEPSGDDDGNRRRDTERKPKRPAGVPFADWNTDCKSLWMIVEIARFNTSDEVLDQLVVWSGVPCVQNVALKATSWPNGQIAKALGGEFYYPNGQLAKSAGGDFYYPTGQLAKGSAGNWYYPNGQLALTAAGAWYYRNGTYAGDSALLINDACAKGGDALCNKYRLALKSDVDDWKIFAAVQLISRASR